ncbi:MAG: dihydropyrimidinase [Actinomycetota bacterium]|nr:dihydropyrimidinase [Actinomycetota bacterium]
MFDLKITSDQVVTPAGVGAYDIYVEGERIAALCPAGTEGPSAEQTVDATGLVVAPGGVEPHCHVSMDIPQVPGLVAQGPQGASRACIFGGTTTVIDFAAISETVSPLEAVDAKHEEWEGDSYADYGFRCSLIREPSDSQLEEVKTLISTRGVPSFKVYMTGPKRASDGLIFHLLKTLRELGGILMVHAENDDLVKHNMALHKAKGRTDFKYLPDVHDTAVEVLAIQQICEMVAMTGGAVYFAHVTSGDGMHAIMAARGRGLPVYGEALHNYLGFDRSNYDEPDGVKYHTFPSLRTGADREALWNAVNTGPLSAVATDDVTTTYEVKTRFRKIFDARGGHSGLDTRLPFVFSEGVSKGEMSLERFVDVTSSNPAKIFGLYPRKGAIAPGSDADLVLIDPDATRHYNKSHVRSDTDYSIWEGWEFKGWPQSVYLRGRLAMRGDELLVELGAGQFVPGQISPALLKRPTC